MKWAPAPHIFILNYVLISKFGPWHKILTISLPLLFLSLSPVLLRNATHLQKPKARATSEEKHATRRERDGILHLNQCSLPWLTAWRILGGVIKAKFCSFLSCHISVLDCCPCLQESCRSLKHELGDDTYLFSPPNLRHAFSLFPRFSF